MTSTLTTAIRQRVGRYGYTIDKLIDELKRAEDAKTVHQCVLLEIMIAVRDWMDDLPVD